MVLLQHKLSVRLSQRQILTLGLVQMVSVLALNKLELKDMINAEMVENPVLEELEESVPLIDDVGKKEEDRDRAAAATTEENPITAEKKDPFEEIDFGSFFQDYLDPGYRTHSEMEDIERPSFENFLSKPTNLTDHLAWQLGALSLRREVREAADLIIGNLNEDGYLIASDDELLGIASADLRVPFDPRDVLARVVDGSRFDEFKPQYGPSLVTGWASIHGYPIGVLANHRGVLFSEEAKKATEFILLANSSDTPLVFLQNTTGYMVGTSYEQGGIIKDGAKMINAVTNSAVPHLTINMASSFGAGNYGMSGRAYDPRFMFAWPGAKLSVMGAAQLAGVMSIVGRASAASAGRSFDEETDRARTAEIEAQIEAEAHSFFVSARLYDDGVIDPRDTRTVLGLTLSAVHSGPVAGRRGFGVFRM